MIKTREEMEATTVAELREICRQKGIIGMSKARKDDIIDALIQYSAPTKKVSGCSIEKTKEVEVTIL